MSSGDAGTGATPDPRGHEGAPEAPLDAPVESAPADPGAGAAAADGREPVPAPGAPGELTSDEDRPDQSPDGITGGGDPAPAITTTSDAAATEVPVVEEAVEGTGTPDAPEGGETARESAPSAPAEPAPEQVPAVRITTSPTGQTVPVGAGKMAAPAGDSTDATTPDQPPAPDLSVSEGSPGERAEARDEAGTTAAGEQIPADASAGAATTTDVPVAADAPAADAVPGGSTAPAMPEVVAADPGGAPAPGLAAEGATAPDGAPAPDAAVAQEPELQEPEPVVVDDVRQPLVDLLAERLGDGFVASHVVPGHDVTVRVTRDAWVRAAEVCRDELDLVYFGFLSAIDWMPSPYGRSEDGGLAGAGEDGAFVPADLASFDAGTTGGETRFQMLARVQAITVPTLGVTLKCDVPADDLVMPTWTKVYAGADWHERECAEMFGIGFAGHEHLVKLYLPGAFEGYPLRKDFPLLARDVKPWPGLVDVEAMPGEDTDDEGAAATAGAEEA